MKKNIFFILIFLIGININAQDNLPTFKQDPNCKQKISGVVKNFKTGEILSNSNVQLFNNGELVSTIEAGTDGSFVFFDPRDEFLQFTFGAAPNRKRNQQTKSQYHTAKVIL